MSDAGVTQWIGRVGKNDPEAQQAIWEAYFARLVAFARTKLEDSSRREADEEDVALSAMHSFYRGMREGRFTRLDSRHDLWRLLVTITARKVCAQRRRQFAAKRGKGQLGGESMLLRGNEENDRKEGIEAMPAEEPTPDFACMVAEECRRKLDALEDESLRQIALWTLEGYSAVEIAEKLGCARRTVERKLERIREKWSESQGEITL
ncbi:MAG: ECF-type sigma factor [Candidatus Hadarchaeum sp.]